MPGEDFQWEEEPFHGGTGPEGRRLGTIRTPEAARRSPRELAGASLF